MTDLDKVSIARMLSSIIYDIANDVVEVLEEEHTMLQRARSRLDTLNPPKYRFWDVLREAQRHASRWGHDLHRPEGKCLFHSSEESLRNPYLIDRLEIGPAAVSTNEHSSPEGEVGGLARQSQLSGRRASVDASGKAIALIRPLNPETSDVPEGGRRAQAHLIQPRVCEQYINGACGMYAFHHALHTMIALTENTLEEAGRTLARSYTTVAYHYTQRCIQQFLRDFAEKLKRSAAFRWEVLDEQTIMMAEMDREESRAARQLKDPRKMETCAEDGQVQKGCESKDEGEFDDEHWESLPYPWDEESLKSEELERGHMSALVKYFDLAMLPGLQGRLVSVPDLSRDEVMMLASHLDKMDQNMLSGKEQSSALFILAGCSDHWNCIAILRHGPMRPHHIDDVHMEIVVSDSRNAPLLSITPFHLHRRIQRYLKKDEIEFEEYLRERLQYEMKKKASPSSTSLTEKPPKKIAKAPYPVSTSVYFASRSATFRLIRTIIALTTPKQQFVVQKPPESTIETDAMRSLIFRHDNTPEMTTTPKLDVQRPEHQEWLAHRLGQLLHARLTSHESGVEINLDANTLRINDLVLDAQEVLKLFRIDTLDVLSHLPGVKVVNASEVKDPTSPTTEGSSAAGDQDIAVASDTVPTRSDIANYLISARELAAALQALQSSTRQVVRHMSERIISELDPKPVPPPEVHEVKDFPRSPGGSPFKKVSNTSSSSTLPAEQATMIRELAAGDRGLARVFAERAALDAGHVDPFRAALLDRGFKSSPHLASPLSESAAPLWPLNILPSPRPARHVLAPDVVCLMGPGARLSEDVSARQPGDPFDTVILRRLAYTAALAGRIEIQSAHEPNDMYFTDDQERHSGYPLVYTNAVIPKPIHPAKFAVVKKCISNILMASHMRYGSHAGSSNILICDQTPETDISPFKGFSTPAPLQHLAKLDVDADSTIEAVARLSNMGATTLFYRVALSVQPSHSPKDDVVVVSSCDPYIVGGVRCLDYAPVLFWPTQNPDETPMDAVGSRESSSAISNPFSALDNLHHKVITQPVLPVRTHSGRILPGEVYTFEAFDDETEETFDDDGNLIRIPKLPELPSDLPPLRRNPSVPIASYALRPGPLFADWSGADIPCIAAWAYFTKYQLPCTLAFYGTEPIAGESTRPTIMRLAATLSLVAMMDLAPVPLLAQSLVRAVSASTQLAADDSKTSAGSIWSEIQSATLSAVLGLIQLQFNILTSIPAQDKESHEQPHSMIHEAGAEMLQLARIYSKFISLELHYQNGTPLTPEEKTRFEPALGYVRRRSKSVSLAFYEYLVDRAVSEHGNLMESDAELILLVVYYIQQWFFSATAAPSTLEPESSTAMSRCFDNLDRLLTTISLLSAMLSQSLVH